MFESHLLFLLCMYPSSLGICRHDGLASLQQDNLRINQNRLKKVLVLIYVFFYSYFVSKISPSHDGRRDTEDDLG